MMNLLVTLDSGYVYPLCCMLRSLAENNPNECMNLYVAHSSLTEHNFRQIKNALTDVDTEIYPIRIDESLFEDTPTKSRITKETYYRILAPLYLPKSVDKILYLDPDTIILNSLHFFYHTDFGDNLIIGAKHSGRFADCCNRLRLGIHKSEHYINSGVLLMNIEKMRASITEKQIFDCISKNRHRLLLAEQDIINLLFDGKIGTMSENMINLNERCFKRLAKRITADEALAHIEQNTMIVHYSGREKPWKNEYDGQLKGFFDLYAKPARKKEISYIYANA